MSKLTFKVCGLNSARTLNALCRDGIFVKNIERIENNLFFISCSKHKEKIIKILNKYNLEYEFKEKKNIFESILSVSRIGLLIGIVLSIILYCCIFCFITDIRINGVDSLKENEIRKYLKDKNINIGSVKAQINCIEIEREILEKYDFSLCDVKIVGTNLELNLKEELNPPIYNDLTNKTPIIATENALITRIALLSGTSEIKIGQSVKKGQLLISCKKQIGDSVVETRAIGEVYGRVWREKEIFIPNTKMTSIPTGRIEKAYFIQIGNYQGAIKKPSFDEYTYTQTSIRIGNFLPVFRVERTYYEQKIVEQSYVQEEIDNMINQAKMDLINENEEYIDEFSRSWHIERVVDGGTMMRVIVEFEKRIDIYA